MSAAGGTGVAMALERKQSSRHSERSEESPPLTSRDPSASAIFGVRAIQATERLRSASERSRRKKEGEDGEGKTPSHEQSLGSRFAGATSGF